MPSFQIHVINSDFEARNEVKAQDVEGARQQGLRAALEIGTDELCKGKTTLFGAQISVESEGEMIERFMVVVAQTPLK